MSRILHGFLGLVGFLAALGPSVRAVEIKKADAPPALVAAAMRVEGRVVALKNDQGRTMVRAQWPGVYFQSAFTGATAYFRTGDGRAIFHVLVDGADAAKWSSPGPGLYAIGGLTDGPHILRIELATECQGGAVDFGGIAIAAGATPAAPPATLARQIEFIGDSYTVGYGNTSTKRQCTSDEVWSATDTSQAAGPLVAKHFHADYQINAISGRGIVRNYGGGGGDPLPQAYPFALFDHQHPVHDATWHPSIIVVALGTNDFSTPLKPGEKWKSRDELHADYERTYVDFIGHLRAKNPHAFFILAANDGAAGEIQAEVRKVVERLEATGEKRVGYVSFNEMELTGCDWHPSLADHRKMAAVLIRFIDSYADLWPAP